MRLKGKRGLITGAGTGIGRALAIEAAARGMHLILTGRNGDTLERTRAECTDPSVVHVHPADVTDPTDRASLRRRAGELFGNLDLLVNNAGVQTVGELRNAGNADLEAMMSTNLVAPMALTRDMLDLLEAAAPSRVVNIGSMFGDIAFPLFAAYSASKFGLRGFSDALRRELKDSGVGVTYAAPRATRTPATDHAAHLIEPFKMTLDAPETVARQILRAVERDARSVYPSGPERLFVLLQRLVPGLIDGSVVGQLRRARTVSGDPIAATD